MSVLNLKKIASRYASALAELVLDENTITELKLFEEIFKYDKCALYLMNPEVSSDDKKQAISNLSSDRLSQTVANLIYLMINKNRSASIPYLCEAYKSIYYKLNGIVIADVSAPTPLDSEELALLKTELERATSKKVQFGDISCDKSLLAGMRVTIEDKRIDFSIKSSLELLKKQLLA